MMNRVKIHLKSPLVAFVPYAIELAETFADKTIKIRVRMFLGTTFDNHVDQFNLRCSVSNCKERRIPKPYLFALLQLNFQQLVGSFLVVEGIHDGQIYHPAQINEVRFRTILNTFLLGNG
jgi:hypothetical protein